MELNEAMQVLRDVQNFAETIKAVMPAAPVIAALLNKCEEAKKSLDNLNKDLVVRKTELKSDITALEGKKIELGKKADVYQKEHDAWKSQKQSEKDVTQKAITNLIQLRDDAKKELDDMKKKHEAVLSDLVAQIANRRTELNRIENHIAEGKRRFA